MTDCNSDVDTTAFAIQALVEANQDATASVTWLSAGQKCGLLMGDYSRAAINTSFDTGTVTGVCCNIFGTGTPLKYVPDFTWGLDGSVLYDWDKALRDIAAWKKLKNQSLTEGQILTLKHIFGQL